MAAKSDYFCFESSDTFKPLKFVIDKYFVKLTHYHQKERIFTISKMEYFQIVLLKRRKNLNFMWDKTWIVIRIKVFFISDVVI